ncbi:hypothetical protein PMZ80_003808 [Knufia obscura]|uniref:Gag protein n=1 Tax=Knufia obscura TaxID=1635080 RepID=A0ABR0RV93_9EURO|nr:hypothetical protein PMZ80_003808 [Knufia obscura]
MSTNLSTLSPSMLAKLLQSKQTISIAWRATPQDDAIILRDSFPKDVAVTFSAFAASKYPSIKTLTAAQMQTHREATCVTITHPRKQSVEKLLDWMIESCRVTNAYFDLGVASYLGIPHLVTKINAYLNHRLATGFIPAPDVQALLESINNQDAMFDRLVEHVSSRVWRDMQARRQGGSNAAASNNNSAQSNGNMNRNGRKAGPPRYRSGMYNAIRGAREDPTVFGAAVNAKIQGYRQAERAAQTASNGQSHAAT